MPELPEVETICRNLSQGSPTNPSVVGLEIVGARVLWPRSLAEPGVEQFLARILGQHIQMIQRRGKFLIFGLTSDSMLVHLRMSGDLVVEPESVAPGRHSRIVIGFAAGLQLNFQDPRKFGRIWLVADPEQVVGGLGPEPLGDQFTPEWLFIRLQSRRRILKPLLLDQKFIAGLGNIYTDEALNMACIHPLTVSDQISRSQAGQLHQAIQAVLREGIHRNGASIDWVYRGGDFQNYFRVYDRAGQPCPECGTPIQRIVVGQRGTHLCPVCQVERS